MKEEVIEYIYKIKHYIIFVVFVLFLNAVILSYSSYRGCYEINLTNLLRLDVLCNACIAILYHIQNFTLNIYMVVGVFAIKKMGNIVDNLTSECKIE